MPALLSASLPVSLGLKTVKDIRVPTFSTNLSRGLLQRKKHWWDTHRLVFPNVCQPWFGNLQIFIVDKEGTGVSELQAWRQHLQGLLEALASRLPGGQPDPQGYQCFWGAAGQAPASPSYRVANEVIRVILASDKFLCKEPRSLFVCDFPTPTARCRKAL